MYEERSLTRDVQRSLHLVIVAVTFGMVFLTITGGFPLTGFARSLGAGDFIYGVLMGLPVVGGVLQVFVSYLLETTRKRKKIFLIGGIIQRAMWVPIALIPYFLPMSAPLLRIWGVILLITVSSMSGAFVNVTFYSWMGDLIPGNIRGRYFSRRSMISTIASCLTGIGVGWFLDTVKGFSGYAIIFSIAALFGLLDILSFIWVTDPVMVSDEKKPAFFHMFKSVFKDRNYRTLVIFAAAWGFSVNISGPFYTVYMMEYLKMSFLQISLYGQVVSNIVTIIVVSRWGNLIDRFGNKPVLRLCALIVASLPFLWVFATPGHYGIVPVINLLAGALWCGVELSNQNLLLGLAPDKNRSMYIAIFFMVTTLIGNALAFVCGGFFLEQIKPIADAWNLTLLGYPINYYHFLFILSGSLRYLSIFLFIPYIVEKDSTGIRHMIKNVKEDLRIKASKRR